MNTKNKLKRFHELYTEMVELFPDNNIGVTIHSINKKDVPKSVYEYKHTQDTGTIVYRDKERVSECWGIDMFIREDI